MFRRLVMCLALWCKPQIVPRVCLCYNGRASSPQPSCVAPFAQVRHYRPPGRGSRSPDAADAELPSGSSCC